ncbi:hypothetical protein [Raineyella sp. LH-20]|uniref:hypothetical protein n=1 Tax=Raineyella sp. LH-20 TaxID=3081204 RepID=UPI0029545F84|nr:hypothetical protein [Raineyella sp. LH-20]WOP18915.1 hypothetical protein R0146_01165 [Raineyella sp. LH-20]
MNFGDRTLLRFLDPAELAAMLPMATGRALLDAAFVFEDLVVGDATAVSARLLALAPALGRDVPVSVAVRPLGGGAEWQATGSWRPTAAPVVHAVLRIDVTAATRGVHTEVTEAEVEPLRGLGDRVAAAADVDAAIDAIQTHVGSTPRDALVEVLRRRGVTDLDDLRAMFGPTHDAGRVVLTLVSDATGAPVETTYRLTVVAQIVEDLAAGLLAGVTAVSTARDGLDTLVDPVPAPQGATPRESRPALLLFPLSALDDADLPLAAGQHPANAADRRASRLAELTSRLQLGGIVPVAI